MENGMDPAATTSARNFKKVKLSISHLAICILRSLPSAFYRNAAEFGQSIEYSLWVTKQFGRDSRFFSSREKLWQQILNSIKEGPEVTVFEFGVAYGYTSRWWLSKSSAISKWHGFDTFTGLPAPWRHFKKGAFSANGAPPDIADSRVEWIKGMVQETFSSDMIHEIENHKSRNFYIFDLDLYEPTKEISKLIFPRLRKGDVLFFDEAMTLEERRVLIEELPNSPTPLKLIGATPMALALLAE